MEAITHPSHRQRCHSARQGQMAGGGVLKVRLAAGKPNVSGLGGYPCALRKDNTGINFYLSNQRTGVLNGDLFTMLPGGLQVQGNSLGHHVQDFFHRITFGDAARQSWDYCRVAFSGIGKQHYRVFHHASKELKEPTQLLFVNTSHPEYLMQGPRFQRPSGVHGDWDRAGPIPMAHNHVASPPIYIPAKPLQSADELPGMDLQSIPLSTAPLRVLENTLSCKTTVKKGRKHSGGDGQAG